MKESTLLSTIRNTLGRLRGVRLFRNQCGFYKEGNRAIHYGIPGPGGSDLIGWTSIVIGPEHIGRRLAIFTAIECKSDTGRVSPKQENFINAVHAAGGFSGVVRTVEEAEQICNQLQQMNSGTIGESPSKLPTRPPSP